MWYVDSKLKQERLKICEACEHFEPEKKTCGPVYNPFKELIKKRDPIIINGEELRTCGCYVNVKASLTSEHCPLGKWLSERLSKVDGCALKDFILSLDEYHVTNEQLQTLFSYKSKISGRHEQVTTCPSCVRDLIDNLKKQVRNLEC